MPKYVLTGGPSVGKTTVIELLASRGYKIVPEAARIVIENERIRRGKTSAAEVDPFDRNHFQYLVAEEQVRLESLLFDEVVFLDRGMVDGYAYCRYDNVPIPENLLKYSKGKYDQVFILEPTGVYDLDGVRNRTYEDSLKLHELIREAYVELGYTPISVPVVPPLERVEFILKKVNSGS